MLSIVGPAVAPEKRLFSVGSNHLARLEFAAKANFDIVELNHQSRIRKANAHIALALRSATGIVSAFVQTLIPAVRAAVDRVSTMSVNAVNRLGSFLRENGNVLKLVIHEGPVFRREKRYQSYDKDGRGKGSPFHVLTLNPAAFRKARGLLGAETFRVRGVAHFVLAARPVGSSEEGGKVMQVAGIRTGLWHLHVESGYLAIRTDGESQFTRTENGARRKLRGTFQRAA